jgi:hypothetical protein
MDHKGRTSKRMISVEPDVVLTSCAFCVQFQLIAIIFLPQAKVYSILMVHNFDVVVNTRENEGCECLEIAFVQDSKQ